jgi:hypothetical protein
MSNEFSDQNPYQAPATTSVAIDTSAGTSNLLLLKKFRSQIHAIGGLWIIFGVMGGLGAFFMTALFITDGFGESERLAELKGMATLLLAILVPSSIAWMLVGIFSCYKKMPAVYVGLVLSYISLIGNLLNFNLCPAIILGAAIFQAHRVISMAGELRKLNISLNAKPTI